MPLISRNPATGETVATFPEMPMEEVHRRLALAQERFESWKQTSFADRAKLLLALAAYLRKDARHYAELNTLEMGRPITVSISGIEKCAWVCEYYANEAERILSPEPLQSDAKESFARFDPLGVILAVMPWNFPFWQVMRFAAPAIMAGNVWVLKHASNVPQCAQALEEMFLTAGFPEGVFQNLAISSARVEEVVKHPAVKAVTLTGSEGAGSEVAMQAGKALKKTVLELGGSDPFIVLGDADVAEAAKVSAQARLQNSGQSCIASKRFIVVKSVADEFLRLMKEGFAKVIVGDPMDAKTEMGPLATAKIRDDVAAQVAKSVAMGAEVLMGGKAIGERGFFYAPTILTGVKKGMPAYDEEIFGPVASVMVVADEEEAIRVANDTKYGLGSSLWTRDQKKAKRLASRIDAGCVFVNQMVKSDPRLPFGGIKLSGYGRELSHYGLKEFVNIKTVSLL